MPLFHDNTGNLLEQLQKLWERIVLVRLAVLEGKIDQAVLERIAQLSPAQLEENLKDQNDEGLNQLYEAISSTSLSEAVIVPSDNLTACLKWFDKQHGGYLDLAAQDPQAIKPHLNHFAIFYNVFIQKVSVPPNHENNYNPDIDTDQVKQLCLNWEKERNSQVSNHSAFRPLRLVDKFLAHTLSAHEWLTDLDILDAFRRLELNQFHPYATTFSVSNIGTILHHERRRHEINRIPVRYVISFVLNDSNRLDQAGTHWTRLLIIVDPTKNPLRISAQYTDSLDTIINQDEIEKTIRLALKYEEKSTISNSPPIVAFPRCEIQSITIQATSEQPDAYSCGYRALQGLLQDLQRYKFLSQPTDRQQELIACKNSDELRNFIYTYLISEQPVSSTAPAPDPDLTEERAGGYYVTQKAIKDQLQEWVKPHRARNRSILATAVESIEKINQDPNITLKTQNYLQAIALKYRTKAVRNLLPSSFYRQTNFDTDNTDIDIDDTTLTHQLMSNLLYLRYQSYRNGYSLPHAKLKARIQEFIKTIRESQNPDLIAAIAAAQQEHFAKLTDHWTSHEFQKGSYLRKLMSEWRTSSHKEPQLQWKKSDFFNTWWNGDEEDVTNVGLRKTMQSQAIDWLRNYKNKWWKRGWVSSDRKKVATAAILQLEKLDRKNTTPAQILKIINEARQHILQNDIQDKRTIGSGTQGRLYQFLNDLETRVFAASSPAAMDEHIQHEFNEIQMVLAAFKKRKIYSEDITKVLNHLKPEELNAANCQSIVDQYKVISEFFMRIQTNLHPETLDDENLSALYAYCQQKQAHLVHYFAQCDQLSAINQQRSIQVFRAMSAAASTIVNQWLVDEPATKTKENGILYENKVIPFHNQLDNADLKRFPPVFIKTASSFLFFNKQSTLNIEKIHKMGNDLITKMAQDIRVQNPKKPINIEFTSLELKPFAEDPTKNKLRCLELTVALLVDGVDTKASYIIKLETGTLVRIKPELDKFDDPPLLPDTPKKT